MFQSLYRKFVARVAARRLAFVNELWRQNSPRALLQKNCSNLSLVVHSNHFYTMFAPSSIVQVEDGTILIPVWPQLRTSSPGISSISTVVATSLKNSHFCSLKLVMVSLLIDVVAFLCTNFILLSKECAQCLFSCIEPLFSTNIDPLHLCKIPCIATITILADTAPPPSLSLLTHNCTF